MERLPITIVLLGIACGGTETSVNKLEPQLVVAPASVSFGEVVVLYDDSQSVQLVNGGRAPLSITALEVEGNDDEIYNLSTVAPIEIAAEESLSLSIGFAPDNYLDYNRDLLIVSDDPDNPELRVPITGAGVDGPVPDIALSVESVDFGSVASGSTSTQFFTITNMGDGELIIDSVEQWGAGAFALETSPAGQTLASTGDESTVVLSYTPTQGGGDSGGLRIHSNDPDEPEVEVVFLGNGGGDFEYPEAVIDCPKSVDPPIAIDLDGTGSSDPGGNEPLTYAWSIAQAPEGSTAEVQDPTADYTSVFIDLAGDWEIDLTVTNSIGVVSAPARCNFSATPGDSISVELTWNTGNSDLDLHLVQHGYEFNEKPGDCCWCNSNPDWGESGSSDDPNLTLDDRTGRGPENITLNSPGDGDYNVMAHYYTDDGGDTTTATINVWLDGVLNHTSSQVLKHNELWQPGYVKWPDGVFVTQENEVIQAETRDCY